MSKMFDVVVIGGGLSGLSCAKELLRHGLTVLLLEARDRIGGRVYSLPIEELFYHVELGAEFIHGKPSEIMDQVNAQSIAIYDVCDEHVFRKRS